MSKPVVAVVMGSNSDWPVMQHTVETLERFGVAHVAKVVSAHRTPDLLAEFAKSASDESIACIIAGAGGAAHLPGMVASITPLPVIGVPIKSSNSIDGWDSILSILQMPNGVPVATVALDAAKNAGILAAEIIGSSDDEVRQKVISFKSNLEQSVIDKAGKLEESGYREYQRKRGK